VAEGPEGQIHHARNLDFGTGGFLLSTMRNISAIVDFQRNGTTVAKETAFLGFIGTLSGQKVGKFSVKKKGFVCILNCF
jgi:N-acylethanolamine-hydrolysing acid amidase